MAGQKGVDRRGFLGIFGKALAAAGVTAATMGRGLPAKSAPAKPKPKARVEGKPALGVPLDLPPDAERRGRSFTQVSPAPDTVCTGVRSTKASEVVRIPRVRRETEPFDCQPVTFRLPQWRPGDGQWLTYRATRHGKPCNLTLAAGQHGLDHPIRFRGGLYETNDPAEQAAIEASTPFRVGTVRRTGRLSPHERFPDFYPRNAQADGGSLFGDEFYGGRSWASEPMAGTWLEPYAKPLQR